MVDAVAGALPAHLPGPGERPLTVLAGSCYAAERDTSRRLAKAYDHLCQTAGAPDIKFLCGDQVYLDHPLKYSERVHPPAELLEKFLGIYLRSWSDGGLLPLLRQGANYLTADDHEFWNEFPSHDGVRGRTRAWRDLALALFRFFQSPRDTHTLKVDPVQFFVLDTCVNRTPSNQRPKQRFCEARAMDDLRTWVKRLPGPGVLVLGEPFFGERWRIGSALGRLVSPLRPAIAGTIHDYEQYRELTGILAGSKHTIVVLGGDVHWGRMAECPLPSGARLIEIISSPLTLADNGISRRFRPWTPPPARLRVDGLPDLRPTSIPDRDGKPYRVEEDHFVTLELARKSAGSVGLAVRRWRVDAPHGGEVVYATDLR